MTARQPYERNPKQFRVAQDTFSQPQSPSRDVLAAIRKAADGALAAGAITHEERDVINELLYGPYVLYIP